MKSMFLACFTIVMASSTAAQAGGRAPTPAGRSRAPVYLTPKTQGGRLVGFERRAQPPRNPVVRVRNGVINIRARPTPARALRETTLWLPGHSAGWRFLEPALAHFLTNPANGRFAAVYVARDGRFHERHPRGRVLDDHEVAATKLVSVQFSNPRAGVDLKSREIAAAVRALRGAHTAPGRLPIKVVTHSAGDTDFRYALARGILSPRADGVRISGMVAVASVYPGTWIGNVGGTVAGSVLRMRQAAAELAEGSPLLAELQAERTAINRGIEGRRIDLAVEGSPTLKLDGGRPRWSNGDGFTQTRDIRRSGATTWVLGAADPSFANHARHFTFTGVHKALEAALGAR